MTQPSAAAVQQFRARLGGTLLCPNDAGYDEARSIYNAMIDRRPALIARCAAAEDAVQAVRFAREHDLRVSIRGGGHNVAGNAVCDGGLMIDLSPMKNIQVDAEKRIARAEAGLLLGDCDRGTQAHGLAVPLGVVSRTGIAGLTLGGGFGWLSGRHGLSCDNMHAAEVVTADGQLRTASATENEDLFWALRGAGANFGVVTRFEYQLHPVTSVFGGLILYPLAQARAVLDFFGELTRSAPDDLVAVAALMAAPDGTPMAVIGLVHSGAPAEDEPLRQRLHQPAPPAVDQLRRMSYLEAQSMLDEGYPPGQYHYWKAAFLSDLGPELLETLCEQFPRRPSPVTAIMIEHWHGAAMRIDPTATAFAHRGDRYNLSLLGIWNTPEETEANLAWIRECWAAVQSHTVARTYVNYLMPEGADRVREAYGPNYERLAALKKKYDPTNFFRLNQNIPPAG